MKNNFAFFTTGEFAKIHHLNNRTLHYYDSVGIFSPAHIGENGYRYYTYEQSIELENILSLKEIGLSIEEIQSYIKNPNKNQFQEISKSKILEIDKTVSRLKDLRKVLKEKSEILDLCSDIHDGQIDLVNLKTEYLITTELPLSFQSTASIFNNSKAIMEHLNLSWEFSNYKRSCGSYISIEKIKDNNFDNYDGIFTKVDKRDSSLFIKPAGQYIRGFSIGDWDKIPFLYERIISFANKKNLNLTGYAFECGLNEFAISSEEEYITQIEILCD